MINVLHIVTRVDTGGISTLLNNYYQFMDHNKVHFDIVAIDTGVQQGYLKQFEELGMSVYYMPENLINRFRFLTHLIKKNRYDVVHCHIELQSAIYLLIALFCGVKHRFAHVHLSKENPGLKNNLLRRVLNSVVTKRLGASELPIRSVFGGKYENESIIINNAVDLTKFSYDEQIRRTYRQDLGLEDKFVLGFVGRLTYQKNIPYLAQIFIRYAKKDDKAILLIAGGGEDESLLRNELEREGLIDRLILLNDRDDVNHLMLAMDVLLLPSRYEGLPLVLVEAQASSLMCLVSDKVTKMIDISPYISYLEIEASDLELWINQLKILKNGYDRQNINSIIREKGFDINLQAEVLTNIYLNGNE